MAGGPGAKSNDASAGPSGPLPPWLWSPDSAGGAWTPARPTDEAGPAADTVRRRLLCIAADLFRRKGFAQSTTRELAELLGLKKASLYYYVHSKQDLLYELCLESVRSITREVAAAVEATPPDARLHSAIRSHVQAAARDRNMHAVMLTELRALSAPRQAEVIEARSGYEGQLRRLVLEEQEKGRLRSDVDCKYLTLMLLNLLNWTIFWYDPAGPLGASQLGELLAAQFFQGANVPVAIGPPPGSSAEPQTNSRKQPWGN